MIWYELSKPVETVDGPCYPRQMADLKDFSPKPSRISKEETQNNFSRWYCTANSKECYPRRGIVRLRAAAALNLFTRLGAILLSLVCIDWFVV